MNVLINLLLKLLVDFTLVLKFFLFLVEACRDGGWGLLLALHQILIFLQYQFIINILQLELLISLCFKVLYDVSLADFFLGI